MRQYGEDISFAKLNLYDNTLNEAIVELSLKGRQMTVTTHELAPDLSTKGCFPKAWIRGELVTESDIITSKEYSIVSKIAFDIYACNHDLDTLEVCKELDPVTYYGMNILDYLTGNTDRHPENWGFLVDNRNNQYISLYPLMDFNQCFLSYDTIE